MMTEVLQFSEECVIESLAFNNLAWDRRHSLYLAAVLKRLWRKSQYQNYIYFQQLPEKSGNSLSPKIYTLLSSTCTTISMASHLPANTLYGTFRSR